MTGRTDWHWEDLKAALRKAGVSLASIAEDLSLSASVVSRSLRWPVSERVDREVARHIGIPPQKIWPSRYHKNGERRRYCALSEAERAAA